MCVCVCVCVCVCLCKPVCLCAFLDCWCRSVSPVRCVAAKSGRHSVLCRQHAIHNVAPTIRLLCQVFCARAYRRCTPLFNGLGRLQCQPHCGRNGHAHLRVCPRRGQGSGCRRGRGRGRGQSCSQGCRHSKRKGRTRVTGNGTPTGRPRFRSGLTADLGSDANARTSVYKGRPCRQVFVPRRSAAVQACGTSWWRSWCKCTGGKRCVQVA